MTANLPVNHMHLSPERGFSLFSFSSHKKGSSSLKCRKLKELESMVNINILKNLFPCCLSKSIFQKYAGLLFGSSWLLQDAVGIYCSDNSSVAGGVSSWGHPFSNWCIKLHLDISLWSGFANLACVEVSNTLNFTKWTPFVFKIQTKYLLY